MSIKIKNLNGTSDKDCTCAGNWLAHWEKKTGKKASCCSASDCKSGAEVGGHVKKVDANDNFHYITPLCKACNKRTDEFNSCYELVSATC